MSSRAPGLVATSARLRLALLRGALRDGPGANRRRLGLLLGALLGMSLACAALVALAVLPQRDAQDLATVLFAALLVGWVVLPVLTFGSDDLLDPARLALLPLTRRQLLTVLGVGSLIGVAPLATVVAATGLLPAAAHSPASAGVALMSVALLLVLCVATRRAVAAALSGVLRSRRGRDLGVALTALVAVGAQLLNPLLQLGLRNGAGEGVLHPLARELRWTPPGLLAAAPTRPLPTALACLAAVALLVAAVLMLWARSVRRSLERPAVSGARRRHSTALAPRWLPLPRGRVGAVAAKDLRYLVREPRRLVAALTSSLGPVLAVVLGPIALHGGRPAPGLVYAVSGVGLLTALAGANRFGMDGSATWLLLSTATGPGDAGRDLLGGDVATAVVAVPVLGLLTVALAALTGGWSNAAPALGLALALLGVGLALSSIIAVTAAFAVPETQNAFGGAGAGQGCTAAALTLAALAGAAATCLPLLVLLVPAVRAAGPSAWGLALLVAGPAYGIGVGALLRAYAARRWAASAPEVLRLVSAA